MQSLQDIEELNPEARELLEAAGYFDTASLKEHGLNEIYEEVVKANNVLEITPENITSDVVKQWLKPLEGEIGDVIDDTPVDPELLVSDKELLTASFAIPLSGRFLEKNEISADTLLAGKVKYTSEILAKEVEGKTGKRAKAEVKREAPATEKEDIPIAGVESSMNTDDSDEAPLPDLDAVETLLPVVEKGEAKGGLFEDAIFTDRRDVRIDKQKIISMDTFREQGSRIQPLSNAAAEDLTRATRRETNEGIDPSSRRYVRGVLHKGVVGFKFAVFAYFMFILCFFLGLLMPFLMLVDKEKFAWAVWSPLLVIVAVLLYLMFTGKAQCPICNQKQFAPKRCLKHRNAHHSKIFGYMLPTALHAFFYKWFRCIFCGTSVRLKE